ncbi:HPr family phosphocarrier protein [Candidatus Woesearchaeota archaeon]|nr:HPr family phosphocarrier protein [Candidatus Woesearchaeota archaeon]
MHYFKTLLEREYRSLKIEQDALIRGIVESRVDIGIDSNNLVQAIQAIESTEEDLRVAMHQFDDHSGVKGDVITKLAHHIFSTYEQHSNIRVKEDPDYEGLAKALEQMKDQVSCVVHYEKSVFDPRVTELWDEHCIMEGDKVVFYMHNLNGNDHSLEELTKYVGKSTEEENLEFIEDVHEIKIEHGFHMRAAKLALDKTVEYGPDIYIKNQDGEEADGKSIMQILTLVAAAEKNKKLTFRYGKPRNPEEEKQLEELRVYIKELTSSESVEEFIERHSKAV